MTDSNLSRTPPVEVRRQLRSEVGFGCPAADCGNPYLEYHHFDPPWNVEHHHDPERMVALCAEHHDKANAWTIEQTRQLKTAATDRDEVRGKFEWMRSKMLAVVGGNFYYETLNMVVFRDEPLIWLERDAKGLLQLNFRMLSMSDEPRAVLSNNDWILRGTPRDVESPPNGSTLRVTYANQDEVSVRFREWNDPSSLGRVFPRPLILGDQLEFPLVTAEVSMNVGGANVSFSATRTNIGGAEFTGNVASNCGAGLAFG